METVVTLRHRVLRGKASIRQAAKELGISRNTARRYIRGEAEIGARKASARASPVKEAVFARALGLLEESREWTAGKQRLTASRLHALLRSEGHAVGYTTVKEIVLEWRRERLEVYVPLVHPPGDAAEIDFFEVLVDVAGKRTKAWMFVMRLLYSGRDFAWLYDRQDQITFLDGHVRAFAHFGGAPARCIYDNLKAAVAKVLAGSERKLSERFQTLTAHYAFEPCFARPRTGHDKGAVEARGKAIRLAELVPIPVGETLAELNERLLASLDGRLETARDATGRTIGEKFAEEVALITTLPAFAFRPEKTQVCQASSQALVRADRAEYSVPREWVRLEVVAHVGATEVEIVGRSGAVRHPRMFKGQRSVDYRHYLPDLARKPQALRQVGAELVAAMGEPFQAAWLALRETHGAKDGARAFAKVLQHVLDCGLEETAAHLRAGLEAQEPLLLALRHAPTACVTSTTEVPDAFAGITVEASTVEHFDALLEAAS